jgi:hypothetical protein
MTLPRTEKETAWAVSEAIKHNQHARAGILMRECTAPLFVRALSEMDARKSFGAGTHMRALAAAYPQARSWMGSRLTTRFLVPDIMERGKERTCDFGTATMIGLSKMDALWDEPTA